MDNLLNQISVIYHFFCNEYLEISIAGSEPYRIKLNDIMLVFATATLGAVVLKMVMFAIWYVIDPITASQCISW